MPHSSSPAERLAPPPVNEVAPWCSLHPSLGFASPTARAGQSPVAAQREVPGPHPANTQAAQEGQKEAAVGKTGEGPDAFENSVVHKCPFIRTPRNFSLVSDLEMLNSPKEQIGCWRAPGLGPMPFSSP